LEDQVDIEIANFLHALFEKYGYDFSEYSSAHIKRRILYRLKLNHFHNISEMTKKMLNDEHFASRVIQDLSIVVTEMFRNPEVYLSIRKNIIPILQTYPFFRIWHAGCATGEEVYSMAILLQEEYILDKATIYATDFNQMALEIARIGIYDKKQINNYNYNYKKAGGSGNFSNFYSEDKKFLKMNKNLNKNVIWANHNLVTDTVFSSVHLIMCRNVLIYFNRSLQNKVHRLFYESLLDGGFLCLGAKESISFTDLKNYYLEVDNKNRIYKKKNKHL
jgi:chemotaxis protein methyltransferase CheR